MLPPEQSDSFMPDHAEARTYGAQLWNLFGYFAYITKLMERTLL